MKNSNMSRNAKEVRRYVFVYCNDDVKLMRLRLLYSDYHEMFWNTHNSFDSKKWTNDIMIQKTDSEYEKEAGKYKIMFKMPVDVRNNMIETVGLKRIKSISNNRGWVLD